MPARQAGLRLAVGGGKVLRAAEHVPEDPLERLDVVLAGHQGGQRAQVEAGQRRWTGHGDGPGEPLTPARIGGYPGGAQGHAERGGHQSEVAGLFSHAVVSTHRHKITRSSGLGR